jgi:hypothetical protein
VTVTLNSQTEALAATTALGLRRVRGINLQQAVGLLPYTTGVTAALMAGLAWTKRLRQPTFAYADQCIALAVELFVAGLLVGMWGRRRLARTPAGVSVGPAVSWVLALHLGILLLIAPLLLLTISMETDNIGGWLFPVLNKRWLAGLYNLAVATIVLFPVAIERWRSMAGAEAHAPVQPALARVVTRRRCWPATAGIVAIVAVVWYFTGPPWNLERLHRGIDWHEQLHLGPLQAISKGYLPYIGPASVVYGPGAQILTYELMARSQRFDIVSFRSAFAAFNFAALVVVGVAAYWWLGIVGAVGVVLLAETYSSIAFYYTLSDGTFAGFYGWANPVRYLAPLIVVPAIAQLSSDASRRVNALALLLFGVCWGVGAWMAQENLSATGVASVLVLSLLWLTQTVSLSRAFRTLAWLTAGLALVVVPILLFYAARGAAATFVRNYFLNPRAVAMGFSNTWWPPQNADLPERNSYYFTLPFLLLLAVATLWRVAPFRVSTPLASGQARFLAFVCVQLVCYQTSLFRSDSTHVRNTMIALPFILWLGFWDLPKWLATGRWRRQMLRAAFVVLAVAVYPPLRLQAWSSMMTMPPRRFTHVADHVPPTPGDGRIAFSRATLLLSDEPILADSSGLSMRTFLEFASDIHDLVGQRKTYIGPLGNIYTGLLYFMADLTPAPYPLDLETMTINAKMRELVIDHMRTHPEDYECFIGTSLEQTEARVFLDLHPGTVTVERRMGPATIYVLLAQP